MNIPIGYHPLFLLALFVFGFVVVVFGTGWLVFKLIYFSRRRRMKKIRNRSKVLDYQPVDRDVRWGNYR